MSLVTEVTLDFSQEDLQQRVAAKFPLEQSLFPLSVTYSDPRIALESGRDRIGFSLTATARFLEGRIAKGLVSGDVKLRFDPDQAALFFDDARIERLEIEGVPHGILEKLKDLAAPLVRERFRQVPVYRLRADDLRHDIARGVIRSVRVEDGLVKVVIGAP
jgi:hypothetical protein